MRGSRRQERRPFREDGAADDRAAIVDVRRVAIEGENRVVRALGRLRRPEHQHRRRPQREMEGLEDPLLGRAIQIDQEIRGTRSDRDARTADP